MSGVGKDQARGLENMDVNTLIEFEGDQRKSFCVYVCIKECDM